ncbi:MAG: hypothetical protein EKK46_03700 [Rhodocyclaceae bacterium]|nr:MAG: hypothetical protein EKK46_03700 [Rhodocyclaceae bacterium]
MEETIEPGTIRVIDGQTRIYQEGYWIKTYPVPEDTLLAKKRLIQALTRRLFNHTEHGLNIPGNRLDEAKATYEAETDPAKKRVKGAMYAGAMFNRATDIFTKLVELQALGVQISSSNDLMRECGRCLQEALSLCRLVLHRSGEEGIDELWGEPFRAFSIPIDAFYESRYVKIGQAMRTIDQIADAMVDYIGSSPMFASLEPTVREFAYYAKIKTETLRTDREVFEVWANLVTAGERLSGFKPIFIDPENEQEKRKASFGTQLICNGRDLIFYITRARVSMPKSTDDFVDRCKTYSIKGTVDVMPIHLPA